MLKYKKPRPLKKSSFYLRDKFKKLSTLLEKSQRPSYNMYYINLIACMFKTTFIKEKIYFETLLFSTLRFYGTTVLNFPYVSSTPFTCIFHHHWSSLLSHPPVLNGIYFSTLFAFSTYSTFNPYMMETITQTTNQTLSLIL